MHIPVYLEVAQWALLFGLAALLLVVYRQLGRLGGKTGPPADLGPPVGAPAAPFRYEAVPGGQLRQLRPGGGQPLLLAFVDPTCPACEQLVTNLTAARADGELAGLQILLLISDPPGYLTISAAFRATSLEIGRPVTAEEVAGYRATGTPLLVAVDGAGVVRSAGVARQAAEIRSFAQTVRTRESEAV